MTTTLPTALPPIDNGIIGYVTIRVPLLRETEYGGYEDPYTAQWLTYGTAELIGHDLTEFELANLSEEIRDGDLMADFAMPAALTELADAANGRREPVKPTRSLF